MRFQTWASIGAIALAAIASQHHLLHMVLLALGVGGAGMGSIMASGLVRQLMLVVSVGVALVTLRRLMRPSQHHFVRLLDSFTVVATFVLVGWSLLRFGW